MDLFTIKKAAKNLVDLVNGKVNDKLDFTEDTIKVSPKPSKPDIDDFSDNEDIMGQTQKFDMKDALKRFRTSNNGLNEKSADLSDDEDISSSDFSALKNDINETIADIDEDISKISDRYSKESEKLSLDINKLSNEFQMVKSSIDTSVASLDRIESAISSIEVKLNNVSNSISGVNKINDSIFDLKNSQINTKNALGDLHASFKKLKRKMTSGLVVISIITAVIAVLEVINLLS